MDTARPLPVTGLLAAGLTLGLLADGLLRFAGPPGLNFFIWIASVALAALVLHRRAGTALDRERVFRLAIAEAVQAPEVARTLDSVGRETSRAALRHIMSESRDAGLIDGRPADRSSTILGIDCGSRTSASSC
jgi:hypothetical protein